MYFKINWDESINIDNRNGTEGLEWMTKATL